MTEALAVVRVGVCSPIGLDTRQTAASIRAGITRKRETWVLDGELEPVVMGHLDDTHLPPIAPSLRKCVRASPLEPRLLRLATRAIQEALSHEFTKVELPLYLATPRPLPGYAFLSEQFIPMLGVQTERRLTSSASRMFADGRAGMFTAIAAARDQLLIPGHAEFVLVGGVDSHLDHERIAALERDGRLRTSGPQDAFTPGEAAACLVLATAATCRRRGLTPLAWITALALAEPCEPRRTTLATACSAVLDQPRGEGQLVHLVMAGLNGESSSANAWGVAFVRNREHFAEPLWIEHPAEYVGDCGAALAPLMLGTATRFMQAGVATGPTLVWACSDPGRCGALLLYPGG
ncbi:beta-ketoacyl synthase N-terminal-like domain-containing protein [Enhygromyxa salina]|uniref:3-oxoacyl-(Acyl carrier protein) synthase n=1 Tax=Enhygromyxa salina TaxID=215803 RepID=A0A2S9YVT8_9BACT|nr:beta-ketoacyl synthase N-terminal-like domain-containing protein [Enhygromyxa salina]PRQ09206.1 3-oxoacyl-(acyl carrier protein) synthase [Enhygromyxa salina]